MNEMTVGIVALTLLLLLFSTGIELGFAMALIGFAGFAYLNGIPSAMNLIGRDIYDVITNYGYTVFPLFILMGQIGFNAGIAVRLYGAANKFVGHIPGGLAMATVLGATAFKAICGSSAATSATFASVAISGMATDAKVAEVAAEEPQMALKAVAPKTVAMARPPGIWPTNLLAAP